MDKTTLLSGYAAVIYVDGDIGNDVSGNGSEALPFKTISKASQSVSVDDTMIYIAREGVYQETTFLPVLNISYKVTFSTVTITDSSLKVYLRLNASTTIASTMAKENSFIGFIIQRNPVASLLNYVYFHSNGTINLSFVNCVFDKDPYSPTNFPVYTGSNAAGATVNKMEYINCSFIPTSFSLSKTVTGLSRGEFVSCAIADANLTADPGNVLSAIFSDDFHIMSSAEPVGVYRGIYAWEFDSAKIMIYNDGKYKKYSNGLWMDVNIAGAFPTEQEMKTLGMSIADLRKLEREQVVMNDLMINQGTLGSGKLFKSTINLDKYFDIKRLEIKP